MLTVCINQDNGAHPVASLFMWETTSYFDALLNEIQNDPTSITPAAMTLMTAMNVTSTLNSTLSKPLASAPMSSAAAAARIQSLRDGRATS